MKKVVAVIPARYASSRFPGKPLAKIHDKPMIQWVYERVKGVEGITDVYVATDDERIFDTVECFGGKVIMTSKDHKSGTDRISEAISKIDDDIDIVLNIQGDEPMIKKEMISQLISAFDDESVNMATLKKRLYDEDDINNPNIAKVITDVNNDATYFSRSTIPYNRDGKDDIKYFKHIGVYGYKKDFLMKFSNLKKSNLEELEQLEQLRVIENGYKIRVIETEYESIGVDLPEHIDKVESLLLK
ncbi:MAG: 3-deoxy-manno-octulosonate cytidylyltransferase [Romboutsia sp.]|uniref:3-deoxy-manno-octulosonate cytidylyltransferase n=1 Tax=Romboutsia sp. TaxID=1965302 RepID=UPI00216EC2E1|nr:3-deoxy-manno-octulosonate cytidylyltransferase [Romboutsia sp.]MCI9259584.1 3-deoxy-manno-octulosonate cytidylyltransferase [Romboutsia sp.]